MSADSSAVGGRWRPSGWAPGPSPSPSPDCSTDVAPPGPTQPPPPPPPEVNTSPIPPNDDQTTRERHAQHTSDPTCYSCHKFMDPIGFGFEHFDGIAIWRDTDNGKPVDASGEIVAGPGGVEGSFDGVDELGELLAHDPTVQACYVAQYTEYATAAPPEQNACLSETLAAAVVSSEGRLDAPLRALVASRWFVERE